VFSSFRPGASAPQFGPDAMTFRATKTTNTSPAATIGGVKG